MNQMNSLRMLLMSVFVSSSLSVWATDDTAIEQLETAVSMAKSKASQNSQDIQNLKGGLPAEAAARIAADELLHQKINEIELTPGPPGPKGDTGDSGILAVAGTSCGAGEVLTGFDASGAIICSEINGSGSGIVGADCATFRKNWLNLGNLQIQPGLDLRGCDLRGLSVTAFNFESTNFAGADLRGVKLEDMNLTLADFSGANLEGAYLVGSELRGANFADANLSHANLGCNYGPNGEPLNCTLLVDAIIDRAIFTGANLKDSRAFPEHNDEPFLPVRPVFGDTICPDGTNSFDDDGDGGTCNNNILL